MAGKYDPSQDEEYQKWQGKMDAVRENKPSFQSSYSDTVRDLYSQLAGRKDFSYDINTDALYLQYRDRYAKQGKLAMLDTAASAQARTGGYGNSYAQNAGQQAYQRYLGQLDQEALSLYDRALERYSAEGAALEEKYDRARDQEAEEYQRYSDALASYSKDLSYLQSQADTAWQRGYQQFLQQYQQQKDNYDRLVYLMEKKRYDPTDEELAAAGMTRKQANALLGKK